MRRVLLAFVVGFLTMVAPALAVQPDEVLPDPTLEARARGITAELRCMVCQNESIDDSDASLARDLRLLVRDRLVAGDSDQQVYDFLVSRYGEFVLLRPRFSWNTLLLWLTAPVLLILGAAIALISARSAESRLEREEEKLSDDERDALTSLMDSDDMRSHLSPSERYSSPAVPHGTSRLLLYTTPAAAGKPYLTNVSPNGQTAVTRPLARSYSTPDEFSRAVNETDSIPRAPTDGRFPPF